jgi:hypothetical protein
VLGYPDFASFRMHDHRLDVAVAVGPDRACRAVLTDEGIVGRDLAVHRQAHHRPILAGQILRDVAGAEILALRSPKPMNTCPSWNAMREP